MQNLLTRIGVRQMSPDELKQVRQARTQYIDFLNRTQTIVSKDLSTNAITPESGQAILKKIQEAQDWLKNNPNANLLELTANQDATTAEIERIQRTDKPKKEFYNRVLALPVVSSELAQKKEIQPDVQAKLTAVSAEQKKWYTDNEKTATEVDLQQQQLKLKTEITTLVVSRDIVQTIDQSLADAAKTETSILESELKKQQQLIEKQKSSQVDVAAATKVAYDKTIDTIIQLAKWFFLILCGSLAANLAIGRTYPYRVFYFASVLIAQWIAPIVLGYAIYWRLTRGRIAMYAVLPLTTEKPLGRLGQIFMLPFRWIPDERSFKAAEDWMKSLEAMKSA